MDVQALALFFLKNFKKNSFLWIIYEYKDINFFYFLIHRFEMSYTECFNLLNEYEGFIKSILGFYTHELGQWSTNLNFGYNFVSIYPEIFLMISLLIFLIIIVIYDFFFDKKVSLIKVSYFLTFVILFWLFFLNLNNFFSDFSFFNNLLVSDYYTSFIKSIVILGLISCLIISFNFFKYEGFYNYEFFFLVLLALLGILNIISSCDLLTLYLAIELQSLSFYILATYRQFSNFSTEAGLKYFILGAFSSGILLFGSSLLYGFTGLTSFTDYNYLLSFYDNNFSISLGVLIGLIFLLVGILFKLGVVPFHMWLIDVYEGVPTIVTVLFAVVPKIAFLSLLTRIYFEMFYILFYVEWFNLLIVVSILSILVGSLGALYQIKIKRILAYSAVSHVGYLLATLCCVTNDSLYSLFFYIIVYMIITISLFSIFIGLRKINNIKIKYISEFIIIFKSNPLLAITFSIFLFSLSGIPPLVGFYSKFYILISILESNFYLLAFFIVFLSVISCMYYIRFIKLMFFRVFKSWFFFFELSKAKALLLGYLLFFNVFFFCYPTFLTVLLNKLSILLFF